MTKREAWEAVANTFEFEDERAKVQLWSLLEDLANDARIKANQGADSMRRATTALYATPQYKAWKESEDD